MDPWIVRPPRDVRVPPDILSHSLYHEKDPAKTTKVLVIGSAPALIPCDIDSTERELGFRFYSDFAEYD